MSVEAIVTKMERIKVRVKCRSCGSVFILRGTPISDGKIETGFKMCLCNSTKFEIEPIEQIK